MANRRIFVICGVNEHIDRIKVLLPQLSILKYTDIGIASFGASDNNLSEKRLGEYKSKHKRLPNIERPLALEKFAISNGFKFYYAEPQDFLPKGRDWHCCELLGELDIAKHFYTLGYDLVYECHTDIDVIDNFIPKVEALMNGKWSFLAHATKGFYNNLDMQNRVYAMHCSNKVNQRARISQECFAFNKEFIADFYNIFKTNKNAWDKVFNKLSLFGDVAFLDIAKNFIGYDAILVPKFVKHP